MTDRPILFSAPMIHAMLDGRKTQTRRILKPQPTEVEVDHFTRVGTVVKNGYSAWEARDASDRPVNAFRAGAHSVTPCIDIRFAKGDRLWVRESGSLLHYADQHNPVTRQDEWRLEGWKHMADGSIVGCNGHAPADYIDDCSQTARPSIHMPRWASRLTLSVTDVRVQRLQEISEQDAIAEGIERESVDCTDGVTRALWLGVPECAVEDPVAAYSHLWESINNPRGLCAEDEPKGWAANPWVVATTFTVEKRNIDQVPT